MLCRVCCKRLPVALTQARSEAIGVTDTRLGRRQQLRPPLDASLFCFLDVVKLVCSEHAYLLLLRLWLTSLNSSGSAVRALARGTVLSWTPRGTLSSPPGTFTGRCSALKIHDFTHRTTALQNSENMCSLCFVVCWFVALLCRSVCYLCSLLWVLQIWFEL